MASPRTPKYAILSHTWETEEVLFDDICDPAQPLPSQKKDLAKLRGGCVRARRNGYRYIWIDTCCINKSSSAELSESINSMFQWYHKSARCYAYLADVNATGADGVAFEKSRWFTRGWTLQELIAPEHDCFYDTYWSFLGRRHADITAFDDSHAEDLAERISLTTGIPIPILRWPRKSLEDFFRLLLKRLNSDDYYDAGLSEALSSFSIAQKMSWAARRLTTRVEDEAYSLMRLFGVNMPLLYGEGRHAFFRLQQEILRTSNDQSILASVQENSGRIWEPCPLLASSPRSFSDSSVERPTVGVPVWPRDNTQPLPGAPKLSPFAKALEISLCLCPLNLEPFYGEPRRSHGRAERGTYYFGILDCVYQTDFMSHPAIVLQDVDMTRQNFVRVNGYQLRKTSPVDLTTTSPELWSDKSIDSERKAAPFCVLTSSSSSHLLIYSVAGC